MAIKISGNTVGSLFTEQLVQLFEKEGQIIGKDQLSLTSRNNNSIASWGSFHKVTSNVIIVGRVPGIAVKLWQE